MKLIILALLLECSRAFYVPGVAPVEFAKNDPVDVKAIKLTSVKTQIPYDYYELPFCKPEELVYKSENLGEILRGDRIVNTMLKFNMLNDQKCKAICGPESTKFEEKMAGELIQMIKDDYHVHLLVDNLPIATPIETIDGNTIYDLGYRLGFLKGDDVYINNHLEFTIYYHSYEESSKYRVVGFQVKPYSAKFSNENFENCPSQDFEPFKITDATRSIKWTYSLTWKKSDIPWASRWDVYLTMKDEKVHWFSIINSIVVVACLTGFVGIIMIRTVRRDIAMYNKDDDLEDTLEESGWKLVHGDVFRPPQHTKLLCSLIGAGIQLFGMALCVLFLAMLGMLSPASRGSLATAGIFLYCFMGLIAGYYSGRLYRTLRGVQWKRAAIQVGVTFPACILGTGFILNFFMIGEKSSGAIPFGSMLTLLFMWLGIDVPLVFVGFYFGFRKQAYQHPVRTNQIPRQVPPQPWQTNFFLSIAMAGMLPFGATFIELLFIFSALWQNQFYYLFGFLFLVFLILTVVCAEIAIVATYFLLCAENYHWWWRSFVMGGSSAFYVLGYSVYYFYNNLLIDDFIPTLFYFTYSLLMSIAFFLFTATTGFYASYWFTKRIYSAVKID